MPCRDDECTDLQGAATATVAISGRTSRPRLPFQGKRAGVTWLLYVDSPGGHWSERLRVVRGVESYDNLAELSDDEAVTAARAACHQRSQRVVVPINPSPVEVEAQTPTPAAAIPAHSSRSKVPSRTKTKKAKPASGDGGGGGCVSAAVGGERPHPMERSLDDMLFAVSNHGSCTRRPMHPSATKLMAATALGQEENDSLLAVMELNSLPSGTDDSNHHRHDGTSLRMTTTATVVGMPPPRTTSLNTTLSEDDTIVGSDRWSVASCATATPLTTLTLGCNEANNGWDAVEIPGLWAATRTEESDEMSDDGADTDECNLLGEADEYWSSLRQKGNDELEQRVDDIKLNDDAKASKKSSSSHPSKAEIRDSTKGRPSTTTTAVTTQDETCDKRKSRRTHTRRSEEDKGALTSSDEDQHVAVDAPRFSHKRASQKGGDSDRATNGGATNEAHRSPSKRLDKKNESEKKQGRPRKETQKQTKCIDLEGISKGLEVGLPNGIPSHLQDSTFAFADEDQSIDPLANFSQRRPLQRLLSPPGKTRPKQDQSLVARVTISPRKQRREPQPFQTTAEDGSQSYVSSGSEEEEGKCSNPYIEQSRRREGATSSGELNAGAVPTQHSLDQNAYNTSSLQHSELSAAPKGRAENSESTIGGEYGAAYPNRKSLQLLDRSATSSGDESSESNTSGYSFGAGLRHLNPNINLNGILDAKAKGQFVQLNLEGKEGVQVVDSLHVRSEHRSGLHQRKVIPDSYLARSFSQITYDEAATEKAAEDLNRSSMGKMLSDINMKNFRRSTGTTNKQTKFSDNLMAFGGRRSKNAENMMVTLETPEGDPHEGKKFFGRNSQHIPRSDRLLLVDKDDGSEP